MEIKKIGIIGAAGGMGESYSKAFSRAGFTVYAFDKKRPEVLKLAGKNVVAAASARQVFENCDYVIYSTPIAITPKIIEETISYAKAGCIVGGFTSIKKFEVAALRKAPSKARIVTAHPLHAPGEIRGQQVAVIKVRANDAEVKAVEDCFKAIGANTFVVTAGKHDKTMANTQVITHFTLLTMALAWKIRGRKPPGNKRFLSSVDGVKNDMALRLLTQNPDVYAGIAMLNQDGIGQIREYNHVLNEIIEAQQKNDFEKIFGLWEEAKEYAARNGFKKANARVKKIFGARGWITNTTNSHISLLAMAITWKRLGIKPGRLGALQSPPYKLRWLLVNKVLNSNTRKFARNAVELEEAKRIDLAFAAAARTWAYVIESGDLNNYTMMWEQIRHYFGDKQLNGAKNRIDSLVKKLIAADKKRV
ncbi:prephenate dehydrogenase [Candidatus Micrarchaeota archaeon]|nr:prephenate dehydrogenase [Candidatus Micrarchaeota archaeon]